MSDKQSTFEFHLPEDKEMFTVRWLARYLSTSVNHVNNLIDSGEITLAIDARNAGSTKAMRRVPRAAVIDFLHRRKDQ